MRGGPAGWGQRAWRARLTCQLTYLRLTTRGLDRCRRGGLSRWASLRTAWNQRLSVS